MASSQFFWTRAGTRAGLTLLLLAASLPGLRAQSAESLPAFDLGYAKADLVLIASVPGIAGIRVPVTVDVVLKGTVESVPKNGQKKKSLFVIQPSGYGLHVRLPAKAGPHLLFLKKTSRGYLCLQRPGIQISIPKKGRREHSVLAFFKLLGRRDKALARDLTLFALSQSKADPLLAKAALLTLARRPDLAPLLGAKEIGSLRSLLADPDQAPAIRDLSARSLVAAKAPGIQGQILALLSQGKARGLGPVFGRLLAAQPGPPPLSAIAQAYKIAPSTARGEILGTLVAFRGPAAKNLAKSLRGSLK